MQGLLESLYKIYAGKMHCYSNFRFYFQVINYVLFNDIPIKVYIDLWLPILPSNWQGWYIMTP